MKNFLINSYLGQYEYKSTDKLEYIINYLERKDNLDLFIIDSVVFKRHTKLQILDEKKIFLVKVSAKTKSISNLEKILDIFSEFNLKKNSIVTVIGGATLQDIIASACCLYFRGIKWIFIPTTALAQGDSCVGSKTSLDGSKNKNQFGVFYPPSLILSCKEFLETLPIIEIYSGLGDILHYLAPYKISKEIIQKILKNIRNKDFLIKYCHDLSSKAMAIKSDLVEIDEFDNSKRAIFNFGHTYGHALEKSTSKYLPHGIAVLMGIYIALNQNIDENKNIDITNQSKLIKKLLDIILLDSHFNNLSFSKRIISDNLKKDKKNKSFDKVNCILPSDLNESEWISKKFEPIYGLMKVNLHINECLTAVNEIANLKNTSILS